MVKNKKGGSSHKKMASKNFKKEFDANKVPLPVNNVNEKTYLGIVTAAKGDKRFAFNLIKNGIKSEIEMIFHLAGSVRKKVYRDALVLVSERISLKEGTFDGIYVYGDKKEVILLISKGFINEELASQTLAYTQVANNDIAESSKNRSAFNEDDYLPPAYSDYEEEESDEMREEKDQDQDQDPNQDQDQDSDLDLDPKLELKSYSVEDDRKRRKALKSQQKRLRQMNAHLKMNNNASAHEYESAIDGKVSIVNKVEEEDDTIIDIDDI